MLDIKWIIENKEECLTAFKKRGAQIDLDKVIGLHDKKRSLQKEFDDLRSLQNQKSKEIAKVKKDGGDAQAVMDSMKAVADQIRDLGPQMNELDEQINSELLSFPNIPHVSVPVGKDESANKEERVVGEKPTLNFKPKDHADLGEALGILDFERGTKISGARFTLYRGAGARLERALINFMIDCHTQDGVYEEVLPPFMVNAASLIGTGQLPKFEADLFKTQTNHYLIPTAEVPVTNIFRDEILKDEDLPKKFVAYTPCFRSEAGSHGKDVRGLIRQHQFNKVELVHFAHPDHSYESLEELTSSAESILKKLGLCYRVMTLSTGDMGFGAAKTYDLEVWLPGQNAFREISSCSNCEDFQARRAKIRFKESQTKKNRFVHTLNGSGLAVGRTLVAILENYQQEDGSIKIPQALIPYMGGLDVIKKGA